MPPEMPSHRSCRGRENIKILTISPFDVRKNRSYSFNRKMPYARALYRTLLDAKGEDMIDLLDEGLGDYYLPNNRHLIINCDYYIDCIKKYGETMKTLVLPDGAAYLPISKK